MIVEDDPYDTELELRELRRHGLCFGEVAVVSSRAEFLAHLDGFRPDVILADYRVPGLLGESSLELAQERCPQVPFIFVSGTLGEDRAVDLLKRGAWDYVLKDRPSRLGPAVRRSLAEAQERERRERERDRLERERERLEREREAALVELRRSQQQMQAIINTMQDGLGFLAAVRDSSRTIVDFTWVYANPVAAEQLGRSPDEVIGGSLLGLVPSLRGSEAFRAAAEMVDSGEPMCYQLASTDASGAQRLYEGRAAKLGDGFVATYRDITDRHRAEQDLRESEARFRGLVLALGEGIVVEDPSAVIIECNEAAERILGSPREQLVGLGAAERVVVLREDGSPLPPAERPALVTLRTGRPVRDGVMGVRRPDGTVRWLMVNAEPLILPGQPEPYAVAVSFRDITELRRAQDELAASEERFRLAFDEALTGMALLDVAGAPGRYLRVNPALCEILGYPADQLLRMGLADVTQPEDLLAVQAAIDGLVSGEVACYRAEQRYLHASGATVWGVLSISMVRDRTGAPLCALTALEDITPRKHAEEELAFRALHDELTGLPNRALLLDQLRSALGRAQRAGRLVGVLFIDLDDFKSVNDSFGHVAGDGFLIMVGERIAAALREPDTAGRMGGDEFVVVCEELADVTEATALADRIQTALSVDIVVRGQRVGAPASIGIAISGERSTAEELLRDADAAMYLAKRQGGRRWELANALLHAEAVRMLSLEGELREALRQGQLRLYYQPAFDLGTMRMVGVEALLRWEHPSRGLLLPQELIAVAERRSLIGPIGSWVLESAFTQAAMWAQRFGARMPVVAVNISSRQLGDQKLTRQVQRLLGQTGLTADKLCLEITESQFISVGSSAAEDLRAVSECGIALAVDDFGAGFAGLDYLRRLPVNTIKIDKSYIGGLGVDQTDTAIVASVVTLGRSLGLVVIAEGIERPDQCEALQQLGCSWGQGWLWYPAMPAEDVEQLLAFSPPRPDAGTR